MTIRFWVEGKKLADPDADVHWFDKVKAWVGPAIWEDSTKPGSYVPLPTVPKPQVDLPEPKARTWVGWVEQGFRSAFGAIVPQLAVKDGKTVEIGGVTGLFGRLRKPRLGEHSTGEVVAILKKVSNSFRLVSLKDGPPPF